MHKKIKVRKELREISYHKGDYLVPTKNSNARFIVETLEPTAVDSYFAWNYFDAILQQKEWFSTYVYEETALDILNTNPEIKKEFELKRKNDPSFAKDAFAQLYFIYKRSNNYEPTHNMYPISRFMNELPPTKFELASKLIGT